MASIEPTIGPVRPEERWLGGERVPMAGIGSLGLAPEWRGRGAASALLRGTLAELHETGVALATLYSSILLVDRQVGFECAGSTFTYELALASLNPRAPLDLVPVASDERDTLTRIRERWVRQQHGAIDASDRAMAQPATLCLTDPTH